MAWSRNKIKHQFKVTMRKLWNPIIASYQTINFEGRITEEIEELSQSNWQVKMT